MSKVLFSMDDADIKRKNSLPVKIEWRDIARAGIDFFEKLLKPEEKTKAA